MCALSAIFIFMPEKVPTSMRSVRLNHEIDHLPSHRGRMVPYVYCTSTCRHAQVCRVLTAAVHLLQIKHLFTCLLRQSAFVSVYLTTCHCERLCRIHLHNIAQNFQIQSGKHALYTLYDRSCGLWGLTSVLTRQHDKLQRLYNSVKCHLTRCSSYSNRTRSGHFVSLDRFAY